MILFIIIEIVILAYTIFAKDWLIYHIRDEIKSEKNKVKVIFSNIGCWFLGNVLFVLLNAIVVLCISFVVCAGCAFLRPSIETKWSFNINALQDNLVTEGSFRGGAFSMIGYVDGELSYFYSRTLAKGEVIRHIPADKTYIKYDDDTHLRIEVHQSQCNIPEWMYKVFYCSVFNGKQTDYYVIIVPEGTIANTGQYNIDMQ